MATYNRQYKWNPPRRKKQRYALIERVIDFSKAPWTSGMDESNMLTTAWAAGDVLEAISVRPGQTVLGVEFELMTRSEDSNAIVKVGYGDDDDFWGIYDISKSDSNERERAFSRIIGEHRDDVRNFGEPLYFAAADTIDLTINSAITQGRVRIIAHILEDDR